MLWRLLWQSIWQSRKRSGLAIFTVAIATSLAMALAVLSIGIGDKMSLEMRSYGSNITVKPKTEALAESIGDFAKNPLRGQDTLHEKDILMIKDIFWRNNIIGISPILKSQVYITNAPQPIPIIGTYFQTPITLPDGETFMTGVRTVNSHWSVAGEWPNMNDQKGVLVGQSLAKKLHLSIADHIEISTATSAHQSLHITGIVTTGGSEDSAVIAPIGLVQSLIKAPNTVDEIQVSALTVPENALSRKAHKDADKLTTTEYDVWYCTAYISSIAHQIEEALPNASAQPVWKIASGEGAVIRKMQMLLLVVTFAGFASAAMGISSLMMATVTERAREIGLLKAIGADSSSILINFISETMVLGAMGGILGVITGAGLSQIISRMVFGTGMDIPWIVIPLSIVLAIFIGLLGAILPAKKITKLAPVEVLYGRR